VSNRERASEGDREGDREMGTAAHRAQRGIGRAHRRSPSSARRPARPPTRCRPTRRAQPARSSPPAFLRLDPPPAVLREAARHAPRGRSPSSATCTWPPACLPAPTRGAPARQHPHPHHARTEAARHRRCECWGMIQNGQVHHLLCLLLTIFIFLIPSRIMTMVTVMLQQSNDDMNEKVTKNHTLPS
jgi:hypothetical protein